jgi:hypothetical protein
MMVIAGIDAAAVVKDILLHDRLSPGLGRIRRRG